MKHTLNKTLEASINNALTHNVPARSGLGTPPTNMVFRGSSGWDPSITKSESAKFHGLI